MCLPYANPAVAIGSGVDGYRWWCQDCGSPEWIEAVKRREEEFRRNPPTPDDADNLRARLADLRQTGAAQRRPCICRPLPTGEAPEVPDRDCPEHGEPSAPAPGFRPAEPPLINGEPAW